MFASGMAALHAAVLAAGAAPGATIVAAQEVYGATQTLLNHLAAQTGLQVRYVRIRDLDSVRAALAESRAAALVFEILTNPLAWVADLPALRGLRTLPLRMREQCRNALTLAQYLSDHPRVAAVHYPGLPDHPDHALARRLFGGRGFGAIVAFDLADGRRAETFAFLERLRVIRRIASLGDVATLASYPAHASHRGLSPPDRAALGIGDGQIRLSVGIEDAQDLIADLAQALDG